MGSKLLTFGLSVVVSIALFELGLRAFTSEALLRAPFTASVPYLVTDPVLGWRNRPGFVGEGAGLFINEQGYRGPPLLDPRPSAPRVVTIGDSGTFGIWVGGREDTFEVHLDGYPDVMRERGRACGIGELINAGVNGYNTSNAVRSLATEVGELAPDIVVVRLGVNDHRTCMNTNRRVDEPESAVARSLLYRLHRVRLVRLFLEAWARAPVHPPPGTVRWVSPERFEQNLRRLEALSAALGAHLLFVDTPLRPLAWGEAARSEPVYRAAGYPSLEAFHAGHDRYQALLERVAAEEGVPLLETRTLFSDPERPLFSALDFVHPNLEGAQVLAAAVLDELARLGWIRGCR